MALVTAGSMVFGVLTYHQSMPNSDKQPRWACCRITSSWRWSTRTWRAGARTSQSMPDMSGLLRMRCSRPRRCGVWWEQIRDGKGRSSPILRQHRSHLVEGSFVCGDYTPAFVSTIQNRIPELKCARWHEPSAHSWIRPARFRESDSEWLDAEVLITVFRDHRRVPSMSHARGVALWAETRDNPCLFGAGTGGRIASQATSCQNTITPSPRLRRQELSPGTPGSSACRSSTSSCRWTRRATCPGLTSATRRSTSSFTIASSPTRRTGRWSASTWTRCARSRTWI